MSYHVRLRGSYVRAATRSASAAPILTLACLGVLSGMAAGQQCEQLNASTPLVTGAVTTAPPAGQNPNYHGYCFTATQTLQVRSGALFTNSVARNDFMRAEIWTDLAGLPGIYLGGGSWRSPQSTTQDPWGFNLDQVVQLNVGTPYWFVWIESGDSQVPEEPGGVILPKITRFGSAPWNLAPPAALKFILCSNMLDSRGVAVVGTPCPSAAGRLGTVFTNESPSNGNRQFNVQTSGFPSGSTAILFFGVNPLFPTTPLAPLGFPSGCELYVSPDITLLAPLGSAAIGAPPVAPRPMPAGHFVFRIPIPSGVTGAFFSTQVFAVDSQSVAPIPLIASNGLFITVF